MQKVKELLNKHRKVFRIFLPILFIWGIYRISPYILMDKPIIETIVPVEIMESTSFNDGNILHLMGKNLKNIIGIYVNDIYESNCVVTLISDEEVLLQLPAEYYSKPQKLDIQAEVRINSDLTCLSSKVTVEVISDGIVMVPEINGSVPEMLGYDGSLLQTIILEGNHFMQDSQVTVNGIPYSTFYDENTENLSIQIPYENWCMEETLVLQVVQYYNGYPTRVKSKKYFLETARPQEDWADRQYGWVKEGYIAQSFGEMEGMAGTNSLEAIRHNYDLGQRTFGVDLTFSADSILYGACCDEAKLPVFFSEAQAHTELTLLRFEDICRLMQEYGDIYIYTNLQDDSDIDSFYVICKYMLECIREIDQQLIERFIIPVRNEISYRFLLELCPSVSMVYVAEESGLSDDEMKFLLSAANIPILLLPWHKVSQQLCDELEQYDCLVYASGVENEDEILYALANGAKGISTGTLPTTSWLELRADFQTGTVNLPSVSPRQTKNSKIFLDYLAALDSERYSVIFSVKDEASRHLTTALLQAMHSLGLEHAPFQAFQSSYLAVIDKKSIIYENCSDQLLQYNGTLENIDVYAESGGFHAGNTSSIQIDGIEYSLNQRGMNIVVYDNLLNRVIDRVCFDLYDDVVEIR